MRSAVRVPLPDGWTAAVGRQQTLWVVAAEKRVLRIDRRPGAAHHLPTTADVTQLFVAALPDARVDLVDAREDDGFRVVRLAVSTTEEHAFGVVVGAKVLGSDLYLCATEPGISARELAVAFDACAGLELTNCNVPASLRRATNGCDMPAHVDDADNPRFELE